jgi:hypothetical protein
MSEYFYLYEHGSGSTWGKYLVPASAYKLYCNAKGQLCLESVVPSSVWVQGLKSLQVVNANELEEAVIEIMSSKEGM